MTTITVELPEHLATRLEADRACGERLNSFLVGAIEAWLNRRQATERERSAAAWETALEESPEAFVGQLIDDNRELFEELARK